MASRGGAVTRRASSSRAGPLAGWAWRDARSAVQFGKRQGAWAVELRPACARFLFDAACGKQNGLFQHARRVARPGGQQRRGEGQARKPSSPASSTARPPTDSLSASGADAALHEPVRVVASKRKQRSAARSVGWSSIDGFVCVIACGAYYSCTCRGIDSSGGGRCTMRGTRHGMPRALPPPMRRCHQRLISSAWTRTAAMLLCLQSRGPLSRGLA